jgi:hypothetical protein
MSIVEIDKEPSPAELRFFGLLFALFCGLVGALLRWKLDVPTAALVVWGFGLACMLVYYAVPALRRVAYRAWVRVTFPLGWTVSHAVLALVYYGVFTPMALIMRLIGRDALQRKLARDASTYWITRSPADTSSRYFKQF